ncbi:hypothetical protein OPV22_005247 [Ensete ventricosum]|uniref:Uncharacterized protein n=1 Tax=Ensete ventricosum TaxID=4639 RepID=A0AAV8RP45_ENSVE|nr:hypothetical protein OPV22_005247 [Ensete ventricosum]RWW31616.1 hypothetical protein GW17_00003758 [Ensete ventricosum]RZR85382.1 hypothetical protein BHM03_00012349 [Ensete ventricosum]
MLHGHLRLCSIKGLNVMLPPSSTALGLLGEGEMAAGAEGWIRCVLDGCISAFDSEIRRRPYHRNCSCALHRSRCSSRHDPCHAKKISYPISRSPKRLCITIPSFMKAASDHARDKIEEEPWHLLQALEHFRCIGCCSLFAFCFAHVTLACSKNNVCQITVAL